MYLTRENLTREVFRLSTPAVLENILQTALSIASTMMVAYLGSIYLAAVALAGVIIWRVIFTPACIQTGAVAMVARYYGARDFERARITVVQALILSFFIGIGVSILGILGAPRFMYWMGAEPAVAEVGTKFLRIVFAAATFRLIQVTAAGCLRAAGDTKTPMFITMFMNATNIFCSWVLIFGIWIFPPLGIVGAALGNVIAILLGAVITMLVYFNQNSPIQLSLQDFKVLNFEYIKKIISLSFPAGLEEIVRSVGILGFMRMIAAIGTVALAAHNIAITIESISFMIGWGFAIAATTLVGQSLGQKNLELARLSFKKTTYYSVGIMSVIGLLFLFFPKWFLYLFKPEPAVLELGIFCVRVVAFEQPLLAMVMTLSGGIRGAGDTISPLITGLVGIVIVRIILSYILAFPLNLGMAGIYYGMVLDWAFRAAVIYYLYHRGRWTRIKI